MITGKTSGRCIDSEVYFNLLYFSRLMFYINSAINPILYNTMSSRYSRNTRYSRYSKNTRYSRYSKNTRYSRYSKTTRYCRYSRNTRYSRYCRYTRYSRLMFYINSAINLILYNTMSSRYKQEH